MLNILKSPSKLSNIWLCLIVVKDSVHGVTCFLHIFQYVVGEAVHFEIVIELHVQPEH